MEALFREYETRDYGSCESLVNAAWDFDGCFRPQAFADLAKRAYTKGARLGSNHAAVVEVGGRVVGFLFGLDERSPTPRRAIPFGLSVMWRLHRIRFADPMERKTFLRVMVTHGRNKADVVVPGRSEIQLFVVDREFQGLGYGRTLWEGFRSRCTDSGVDSIVVETNHLGASRFYERIGFAHKADFDSPLHEYATKEGQACVYEYHCTPKG